MDKEIIKIMSILYVIVCYFVNLMCMFCYKPLEILIANVVVLLILIAIFLGFRIVDWLND